MGKFLTPEEVADRLNICVRTVYRWLNTGKMPGVKLGERLWRIQEQDIHEFISQQRIAS